MSLTKQLKKELAAKTHHLNPVVILGDKGLTENVINEINIALDVHELIKIRVNAADRDARAALVQEICERTQSELIHKIGHVVSIYRANPKK